MMLRRVTAAAALLLLYLGSANACPNCKEPVAQGQTDWAYGFSASTLGMMSVPYLVMGSVFAWMWWTTKKMAAAAAAPPEPPPGAPQ